MKHNFSIPVLFVLMVLLLSACVGQTGQANTPRTLSVNGNAQVMLAPDVAYVSVGVHTDGPNAAEAVAKNNELTKNLMNAIQALGVAAEDMRTTTFNISPQQQYDQNGQLTGTIFMVDNTVYITLRDMNKIGDVLGAAVNAGANNIYGVQFDVADKSAALSQARAQAIANARAQADEIAAAAGVKVVNVQAINFYNNYPSPVVYADNKVAAGIGGGSVPVSSGQITLSVDVNVTYEIK